MYNYAVYAPNSVEVQHRYVSNSELTRARLGGAHASAYGQSEIKKLNIFRVRSGSDPVVVFIHRGWRSGFAKHYAFLAHVFTARGAHFAIPDFLTVPDFDGSLIAMEAQVRKAIK